MWGQLSTFDEVRSRVEISQRVLERERAGKLFPFVNRKLHFLFEEGKLSSYDPDQESLSDPFSTHIYTNPQENCQTSKHYNNS